MSRAAATARLGLTRTAVGDAVAWLTDAGILEVAPDATASGRGRPSPLLRPAGNGPVVVAAHLRPARADIAVAGLGASILVKKSHPIGRRSSPGPVLKALAGWMLDTVTEIGRPCAGVAVGLAGMTRAPGIVRNAVHFGWDGVPAAALLSERLPDFPPVRVENDSALSALAEFRRGAGKGARTLLVLSCEHTGIGGALLGGALDRSGAGHALEAGHLSIDLAGVRCPCGQRGCLEMYADGRAILRAVKAPNPDDASLLPPVLAEAAAGIAPATAAVAAAAEHLGVGLSSLINVLSPDRVVLAGVLGDLLRTFGQRIREQIVKSVVARTDKTEIVLGQAGEPVLVGAAELAFEHFLADPHRVLEYHQN
jgi:predicted NBD/HSP70 family sugar kinase